MAEDYICLSICVSVQLSYLEQSFWQPGSCFNEYITSECVYVCVERERESKLALFVSQSNANVYVGVHIIVGMRTISSVIAYIHTNLKDTNLKQLEEVRTIENIKPHMPLLNCIYIQSSHTNHQSTTHRGGNFMK